MSTEVTATEEGELQETPRIIAEAQAIEVQTPEQAKTATEFLSQIAAIKRHDETARKTLVKPLNDHVKMINEKFKRRGVPLDEADKLVRGKVVAYQSEQERLAREEQARLDAARRQEEQRAEAERQKAVEEAQRVEREAREADERRRTEIAQQTDARRREIAEMSDEAVTLLAEHGPEPDASFASDEIESRRSARIAKERAAAAEQAAEEARQREIAAKSAPTAVAVSTPLASSSGSASTTKRWQIKSIDAAKLPPDLLVPDEKEINRRMREGVKADGKPPEIPGVEFEQATSLSVRSR